MSTLSGARTSRVQPSMEFPSDQYNINNNNNPKREITVPRLELVASSLCEQMVEMLHKELGIMKGKIFCYSGSETTLWWLTKPPSALLVFVLNRVQMIIDLGYSFNYVSMLANPADVASRGCTPDELLRSL